MCHKKDTYFKHIFNNYYFNKRLIFLGIEKKYIAFYYLSDIMCQLINEDMPMRSFSTQIYPMLAKKYKTKDCTIERDIRTLIAKKWQTNLKFKLSNYWMNEEPPSCCQFIKIIKCYLLEQIA